MLSGCHRLALFSLIAVYAAGALENGDCDGYRVGLARTVAAVFDAATNVSSISVA